MTHDMTREDFDALLGQISSLREHEIVSTEDFRTALNQAGASHWTREQQGVLYKRLRSAVGGDGILCRLVDARLERISSEGQEQVTVPASRASSPPSGRPWYSYDGEDYWLEISDRPRFGENLTHHCFDRSDKRMQSWILAIEVMAPGDTVYHFDVGSDAVTGRSTVVGPCVIDGDDDDPWWTVPLADHQTIGPIRFEEFESETVAIEQSFARIKGLSPAPYYLPFEIRPNLRLRQTYLAKLPSEVVELMLALWNRDVRRARTR